MFKPRRFSTTGALVMCLIAAPWSGARAAEHETLPVADSPSSPLSIARDAEAPLAHPFLAASFAHDWRDALSASPASSDVFAQRGPYGRGRGRGRGPGGNRNGAAAAIVVGAVASITGAAILVYANRPECSTFPRAEGCGYGTKVVGGAVLSAGVVSMTVGALSW